MFSCWILCGNGLKGLLKTVFHWFSGWGIFEVLPRGIYISVPYERHFGLLFLFTRSDSLCPFLVKRQTSFNVSPQRDTGQCLEVPLRLSWENSMAVLRLARVGFLFQWFWSLEIAPFRLSGMAWVAPVWRAFVVPFWWRQTFLSLDWLLQGLLA